MKLPLVRGTIAVKLFPSNISQLALAVPKTFVFIPDILCLIESNIFDFNEIIICTNALGRDG